MFKKNILVLLFLGMFLGCGPLVLVPPEIDLLPFQRVGLISFTLENAEGRLAEIATQRFLQDITYHQRGAQVIELGTLENVLDNIDKSTMDQDAAAAIGEQYDVTAFFFGKVSVSDVKPQIGIDAFTKSMSVQATFNISITARFISTETGATLWTDSVGRDDSIAALTMVQGQLPFFGLENQEKVYRDLVERLIRILTRDFRPTRQRL
jgi:hypothetical protein